MNNYIISGCFDIWHEGHASLFKDIFTLCKNDKDFHNLIVYMNSDKSVKRLKGDSRPVNTYEVRKRKVLEETRKLGIVDDKGCSFIGMFREFRQADLTHELKKWKSEYLIYINSHEKLSLYKRPIEIEYCIENGIRMIFLPYVKGYSTTKIIEERNKNE